MILGADLKNIHNNLFSIANYNIDDNTALTHVLLDGFQLSNSGTQAIEGNAAYETSGSGCLTQYCWPICNQDPTAPTSLGPANLTDGSYTSDTTPTLTFTLADPDAADTVKYQIQIDDTSDFSSPIVDYTSALLAQGSFSFTVGQATGSGTYTTGSKSQTLSGTSYYWRVKTIDNSDAGSGYTTANSGSIAFIIDTGTPDIVAITCYQESTQTNQITENIFQTDNETTFSWTDPTSASDDTFYYKYDTSSSNSILSTTGNADGNTTNNYINDHMLTEGTHYMHVQPLTGSNVWGTERIFTIKLDTTAPTPDPSTFVSDPAADSTTSVTMTATIATDAGIGNIQYQFEETSGNTGGTSSAWQTSNTYTDTGLNSGTTYSYKVRYKDSLENISAYSLILNATTKSSSGGTPAGASDPPTPPTPTPDNPEGEFKATIIDQNEDTITLKLFAGKDTAKMSVSDNPDFKDASIVPYQEEIETRSTDTIYVRFYTQYGVASEAITIISDETNDLQEGDIITGPDKIRVYVVKNNHKRHIFNPDIFSMYPHLKGKNIKQVPEEILDSFQTSGLYIISPNGYKVYLLEEIDEIEGTAIKHHLDLTSEEFEKEYNWNEVFEINEEENKYYRNSE